MSSSLPTRSVCVDVFGVGLRFPSMRGKITVKKEAKKKAQEVKKQNKTQTLPAHLEAMYSKPNKPNGVTHTLPAALTPATPGAKARCVTPNSPENSYMSVRVGQLI